MTVTAAGPAISEWWRYPQLAVAMKWSEGLDDRERARLIATGIADRHTPDTSVRYLVSEGEFAVAETALEEIARLGVADDPSLDRLSKVIEAQQRTDTAHFASQARLLAERAERIGRREVDVAAVVADAGRRRADAMAHLDELDQRIEDAEREHAAAIRRELDATFASASASSPESGSAAGLESGSALAWRDQIEALLAAREFPAARQVLQEGPGSLSLLPVEEPTATWPWKTAALEEILDWFQRARAFAPQGLRDYVADASGEKLLAAMRELTASDAGAHAMLVEAVEELIGVAGLTPRLEPLPGGGHRVMLQIPDEFRLPPMSIVGRGQGLPLVIAADKPARDGNALVIWLAPRIRERRDSGSITLDLSDLLSLLQTEKRHSGRPRSSSSRRMGLIRMICQQLPVPSVLAADAFAGTSRNDLRHQLWWLLYALGVSPDGVAVDTLLDETGSRSPILVQALNFVVEYARKRGFARLEPETFGQLRGSESYRSAVEADIWAEVGDAGAAALFTMIFFTSVDDLRSALDTIAADAGLERPLDQLMDLPAVTAQLRQAGYLAEDEAGTLVLCESGVTRLMRRGDPHEVAKQALARLAQAGAEPATGADSLEMQLQEAQFQRWLAEIHLHSEIQRARMAEERSLQARGETPTTARILYDRNLREERQRVETWRNERVQIDLAAACRATAKEIETFADHVDINTLADGPVIIIGSRMALRIALHNIISNAQQAVEESRPQGERDVFVSVSVSPAGPSHAQVDVEDNGPGMPPGTGERLLEGASLPSSRHEGDGEGIVGAIVLLRLLGGSLEVLPEPSPSLGGAHVRIRIPLFAGQQSSGSQ